MMKKKQVLMMSMLLWLGMFIACSSDEGNTDNPFVGLWEIIGIEDEGVLSDYNNENQTVIFYSDGRFAYTPYIVSYGGVNDTYDSSELLFKMSYSKTEQELYIYNNSDHRTDIYNYSFSNNYKTLRVIKTKSEGGSNDYLVAPPDSLKGKTLLLKRVICVPLKSE